MMEVDVKWKVEESASAIPEISPDFTRPTG